MEMRPHAQQPIASEIASLEYVVLQKENEWLRKEKDHLKALLRDIKDKYEKLINERKRKIENLERENNQLSQKLAQLTYEQEHVKNSYLQQLQRDGRVCTGDCILCAIVWICRNKLDEELKNSYCGRLLENIIILEGAKNITKEDLKCGKFMRMLKRCGIVTNFKVIYHKEQKFKMIKEAWNALRRNNERVCLLATMKADGAGHALVVDVEKAVIWDPQNGQIVDMNDDFFKGLTSLTKFSVNLEKLGQIVRDNMEILHYTDSLASQHTPMDVQYIKWR